MHAVVFRSPSRDAAFCRALENRGVRVSRLDFSDPGWIDFDFTNVQIVIYYPSFFYSSNHPLALTEVNDNLAFLASQHPHLLLYPDPNLFYYYNDKYRQYLFLHRHCFPTPRTIPLVSTAALERAQRDLGFPMIVKNRYGAGGDYVYLVNNRAMLDSLFRVATCDFFNLRAAAHLLRTNLNRLGLYFLIKRRRAQYPFLSAPLLAQEFLQIDRDLKTVTRDTTVIEAHWRRPARPEEWKMNIDGGGIGEWSYVPPPPLEISAALAHRLSSSWLNIDFLIRGEDYLISEFSPVWHHYAYMEHDSFVYKDDYNMPLPLDKSLDLEGLIAQHLVSRVLATLSGSAEAPPRNRDSSCG